MVVHGRNQFLRFCIKEASFLEFVLEFMVQGLGLSVYALTCTGMGDVEANSSHGFRIIPKPLGLRFRFSF